MTVRSELKKLVDLDTYEETKEEDGGLTLFVRSADMLGADFYFTGEQVSSLKQAELAALIASHFETSK